MDLTQQANEMITSCTEIQRRLWQSWMGTVQGFSPHSPVMHWEQLTKQQLDAWEHQTNSLVDQMQGILDAQSEWAKRLNHTPLTRLPKLYDSWLQQVQELAETGTRVNREIVEGYMETGKHLNPIKVMDIWSQTVERSVEASGEVFQKVMATELALLPGGAAEAEKKPGRKKAAG